MDLSLISPEAWTDFAALHPQAASFLLHASLEGERRYLQREVTYGRANAWQHQRLQELEHVCTARSISHAA